MLAQDTQCVQSLCTGRYDALYVQRYRLLANVTPRILVLIHHTVNSSHDQSQLYDELTCSSSGIITDTKIAIAINFAPVSKSKFCSVL